MSLGAELYTCVKMAGDLEKFPSMYQTLESDNCLSWVSVANTKIRLGPGPESDSRNRFPPSAVRVHASGMISVSFDSGSAGNAARLI